LQYLHTGLSSRWWWYWENHLYYIWKQWWWRCWSGQNATVSRYLIQS